MATIREGDKTALLIVDMQVGVVESAWQEALIIINVRRAVEKARAEGIPVIWIQHTNQEMPPGSPAWQIVPGLAPLSDEIRIDKHFNSSFEETTLEETLAQLGITHIVLAGAMTNWCIQSTAYAALERGYDLTLIADAHTTEDIDLDDGEIIKASDIVQEFNTVTNWVRYPGRTNRVVNVNELDFTS